jgi:hypothetical protein
MIERGRRALLGAGIEPRGQQSRHAEEDRNQRKRTPPVLPQGRDPVVALSPGPEKADHDKQYSEDATYARHALEFTEGGERWPDKPGLGVGPSTS